VTSDLFEGSLPVLTWRDRQKRRKISVTTADNRPRLESGKTRQLPLR